ncbi:MAG: substrate-binding domain-containing protein [Pseudomonadota bacterium]
MSKAAQLDHGRRTTIADLATSLGLTKGTVSRALNDYPDIAPCTRLRVRREAERMNYRPLGSAQAIRTGRCRALGLVLEMDAHDGHRPFLAEFLAGLSEAAAAEGWTLTVATAQPGAALETYRRLIDERKADGFVLPRTRQIDPRVTMLRRAGVPFVLFGRHGDPEGCAWFDIDGAAAMREAVRILVARGHRRIAYIGGSAAFTYEGLRADGFRQGLRDVGIQPTADLIRADALTRSDGAAAADALLALPEPPTGIVCAIDLAALGVWRAARTRGLTVGRDIAVIGYDGDPEGVHAEPPLATFAVDYRTAGTRLADLLIRRVRGEAPEALREIAPAQFLDRGSAAARSIESNGRNDT